MLWGGLGDENLESGSCGGLRRAIGCGADRAVFMATLIMTAKLNDIDPQAWLADVLARIADMPVARVEELLP
jgi:hypothetical protein